MESSKKVWQPPSKPKQPGNTALAKRSTTTGSRTSENKTSTNLVSSNRESSHVAVKDGPVSRREESLKSASKVSKTTAMKRDERTNENAVSAAQNNYVKSQTSEMVNNSSETTAVSPAVENGFSSSVPLVDDGASSQPVVSANRRLSDVNEPTKQPVAARLAAWKKKTAAVENASTSSQHSASRDKLHTINEVGGGVHRHLISDKVSHIDAEIQHTGNTSSCAAVSTGKASDSVPTTRDTRDVSVKKSFPPLKDGEVRQRMLPRRISPAKQATAQPSWKKLGPATFEIQQKLTAMCENWKRNEIAEKSRKERADDLVVVENRWRNGILADEQKEAVAAATCVPSAESKGASETQVD